MPQHHLLALVTGAPKTAASNTPRHLAPACGALLLALFAALPAVADRDGGCWAPGNAPALFAWTDTPAVACRERSAAGLAHPSRSITLPPPTTTQPNQADASRSPSTVTFSGSAYFGIATAF